MLLQWKTRRFGENRFFFFFFFFFVVCVCVFLFFFKSQLHVWNFSKPLFFSLATGGSDLRLKARVT